MNLFIWGTGKYAKKFLEKYRLTQTLEGFIDNNKEKVEFMGKKVVSPLHMLNNKYDCIIVATASSNEIYLQCQEIGIDLKKVIFMYNNLTIADMNVDYNLVENVLGKNVSEDLKQQYDTLKNKHHIIPDSHSFNNIDFDLKSITSTVDYNKRDYVRMKTLEMIIVEIKRAQVKGEMAELGVFRGDFSKYLNYAFPKKKLYLFDSFEGFEPNEAINEMQNGNCTDDFINTFTTNEKIVLSKMTYPENIIIKKGYFPESLNGLEETFSFVSLDADFEESTLAGLRYFYPRLSAGGYIFIHDYNYCDELNLTGVRIAVERYENEIGTKLHKVPICDQGGTLIISK